MRERMNECADVSLLPKWETFPDVVPQEGWLSPAEKQALSKACLRSWERRLSPGPHPRPWRPTWQQDRDTWRSSAVRMGAGEQEADGRLRRKGGSSGTPRGAHGGNPDYGSFRKGPQGMSNLPSPTPSARGT